MAELDLAKLQKQLLEAQKVMEAAGLNIQLDVTIDTDKADEIVAQAEGVLAFLENPKAYIKRARSCSWCERTFIPLPPSVGYCSNSCRKSALAEWGLSWDSTKPPEERWGIARFPLVVPPEVVELLKFHLIEPLALNTV